VDSIPRLPKRNEDAHKGQFGRALLVGGSRGMTGAMALAGMATLRSGAGLVTLAVPSVCVEAVAAHDPCYMTLALPDDSRGRLAGAAAQRILELAERFTVLACGPGLGGSDAMDELVRTLYARLSQPMVFDADGLNALARHPEGLADPAGPRVLTPHPGEFQRLVGRKISDGGERRELAVQMAARHGVVVVLKGHRTLVTDGAHSFRNTTGNPGMATGGSGDVLTGVVTALLCQGLSALDAARLGVYAHGWAGDLAAERHSQVGMTPVDIVDCLPNVWQRLP